MVDKTNNFMSLFAYTFLNIFKVIKVDLRFLIDKLIG